MGDSADRSASPVTEGEVLAGKYRVERILGKGGMGVVVAATHVTLRQKVAIKFLLPEASGEIVARFLREARAAVRLKSDHVARVIDVGELPSGAPYMVMEYLDGNDLSQVLKRKGALSVADAVDYVLQACEAIAEAHVAGIVHRDLKPANLFLTTAADGTATVKVLDFGISKDAGAGGEGGEGGEEELALTRTTAVLGSPHFMAPEQMRSTRSVDARADIWSLGAVLYQLTTKTVPYKAPTFMDLVFKVMREDAPPPSTLRSDLPPEFDAAVMGCLQRDRDRRFATITDLARALAPLGRSGARRSADRIARMQGAAPVSMDRQSWSGVLPTPSVVTPSTPPPSTTEPPLSLPRMHATPTPSGEISRPRGPASVPPTSSRALPSISHGPGSHAKTAESPGKTAGTWAKDDRRSGDQPANAGSSSMGRAALFVLGALAAIAVGAFGAVRLLGPVDAAKPSIDSSASPPPMAPIVAEEPPPLPSALVGTAAPAIDKPASAASATASTDHARPPVGRDAPTPANAAATAAPTSKPTPAAPKPAPARSAAPAQKKNVLDMDIQ